MHRRTPRRPPPPGLLAVAGKTRKVNYAIASPAERAVAQRAQHQLAAPLLTLFNKRVGAAHLADVLGRSEPGITVLLRKARQEAAPASPTGRRGSAPRSPNPRGHVGT